MFESTRLGLATLLILGAACQPAPKTETANLGAETPAIAAALSAEDTAAIRAIDVEWARAATAGEAEALTALYAPDATVLPPMSVLLQGEAAKKYWADFAKDFSGTSELTATAIEGRGDLAVVVGEYRSTPAPKKAGAKALPAEEGKYLEVLEKQADGSWKIKYDIWNANAAPAKQ